MATWDVMEPEGPSAEWTASSVTEYDRQMNWVADADRGQRVECGDFRVFYGFENHMFLDPADSNHAPSQALLDQRRP